MTANRRSPVTDDVQALITDKPITCREVAMRLDIPTGHAQSVLRSIAHRGDAVETTTMGAYGKIVAAFVIKKPKPAVRWERGWYMGEPRALRYVPREHPVITLGCIGIERGVTPAGGGEAVQ